MALNDPLGDMLARIHNAQMRNKSKVSTPASRLRRYVLDVLKSEGFIRGYASVEHASGRHEIEICGVDPKTRGRRMDECLQILRSLADGTPVTFDGEFFSLQDALIVPAPSQRIPLIVGGRSAAAVSRAGATTPSPI